MCRSRVVLALAAAALALVSSAGPASACEPGGPVVAHRAGGEVVPRVLPVPCRVRIGYATSETALVVTPKGTLVFAPALTENSMARSTDAGRTWTLTAPAEMEYTALWNTVDPVLAVDRATGRVFAAHATGPTRTFPVLVSQSPLPTAVPTSLAAAYGFQVYRSSDEGKTWATADYRTAPVGDWEKVVVGPPRPNASRAEQPVGYPSVVYLCGNSPLEVTGPGRICYRSLDGGATFAIAGYVTPSPRMPPDVCPPLAANTGVVAGDGVVYQPVSCTGGAYVAVSEDQGVTYTFRAVPDSPVSNGLSGQLQIVMDQADTLYAMWVKEDRLEMVLSRDQGRTWSRPQVIGAPGVGVITRPAPAAGKRGEFGVAYYGATDRSATKLSLYVTHTSEALDAGATWISGALNDPAKPVYVDAGLTGASPRADYISATFDESGSFWTAAVEQLGDPDANNRQATTGVVGRLVPAGGETKPPAGACMTTKRLVYKLGRVRGGRVVRATVVVDGTRVLLRRGRNLRRIALDRPRKARFTVKITTVNSRGSGVVTTRTYRGCTRTKVTSRPYRAPKR